jgi:dynein heavy chain
MITEGLNSSLLVKDPETNEILVNFDPQVHELLKEAVYMQKMNLEISENARNLILQQPKIEGHYSQYFLYMLYLYADFQVKNFFFY